MVRKKNRRATPLASPESLREVELDAGKLGLQLRQQLRGQLILVLGTGPLAHRLLQQRLPGAGAGAVCHHRD